MSARMLDPEDPERDITARLTADADRLQGVYAASRRAWAERIGRPYEEVADSRPPPGEVDAEADE